MIHNSIQFSCRESKKDEASTYFDRSILRLVLWPRREEDSAKTGGIFRVARVDISTPCDHNNDLYSGIEYLYNYNKEDHKIHNNYDFKTHSSQLSHRKGLRHVSLWPD